MKRKYLRLSKSKVDLHGKVETRNKEIQFVFRVRICISCDSSLWDKSHTTLYPNTNARTGQKAIFPEQKV